MIENSNLVLPANKKLFAWCKAEEALFFVLTVKKRKNKLEISPKASAATNGVQVPHVEKTL